MNNSRGQIYCLTPLTFDGFQSRVPVRFYIASDAAAVIPADEMRKAIERHAAGDWGLLAEKEWKRNDCALRNGGRVLSIYEASGGQKFCVMTRSSRQRRWCRY